MCWQTCPDSIVSFALIHTCLRDLLLVGLSVCMCLCYSVQESSEWELRLVIMIDLWKYLYSISVTLSCPWCFQIAALDFISLTHLHSCCVLSGLESQTSVWSLGRVCVYGSRRLRFQGHPGASVTLRSPPLHLWAPPRWKGGVWTAWGDAPLYLGKSEKKRLALLRHSQWSLLDYVLGCS